MQMDATARSAAARMSSSITPSTSAVPAPDDAFLLARGARNLDRPHPMETRILFAEHTAKHGPYQRNLRPYANPPPAILRKPPDTNTFPAQLHRIDQVDPTQHERDSPLRGGLHCQALQPDADNIAQYWMDSFTTDYNVIISAVEATHFTLSVTLADSTVPKTFWNAMKYPQWAAAIDKELTKFEVNKCFTVVPLTHQHIVPMMWLFNIKTDGTKKARLVGRGDRMIPFIDFDPNAVYCGNVAASSIKIALVIAAMYKLVMRGGDLVGAYLVTQANPDFPVHIQTPQGYQIAEGMCIRAVGNLYGFPPAGQNFSKEFDKCLRKCGYENTPWDPKFFFKWVNDKPIIVIAHSDDFLWFGPDDLISEWDHLVATYTRASYRNHVYCDLLTDLATGRIYPIYTKDRSASELVTKVSIFFALHLSWQNQYDNVDRFIRLDPERNYCSEAFLQITVSFGYRLERTLERDKHANGVAERTVGV
jgi:Reverse transcriptase (RNA-dependent DNA polymerase)